jgi:pyridoxal/pyridoxine/pyridoxamine kinase
MHCSQQAEPQAHVVQNLSVDAMQLPGPLIDQDCSRHRVEHALLQRLGAIRWIGMEGDLHIAAFAARIVEQERLSQQGQHLLGMVFVVLHRLFFPLKCIRVRDDLGEPGSFRGGSLRA